MAHRIPDAQALLEASADFLEDELLPNLSGAHRFKTRVTLNVLRIVARELVQGPAADVDEKDRLQRLLQRQGSINELRRELSEAILSGKRSLDDAPLIEHLRATLRDALAIHNPKWVAPEFADRHPQGE